MPPSAIVLGVESLVRTFAVHADRRVGGTPTPVALIGPDTRRVWLVEHPRVVFVDAFAIDEVVAAFITGTTAELRSALLARLLRLRGTASVPEGSKLEVKLWSAVGGDALLDAGDADGHLLIAHLMGSEPSPSTRLLAAAQRILGHRAPAILIEHADIDAALRVAVLVAEAAPQLAVAVTTTPEQWHAWLDLPGRDRARALVRACSLPEAHDRPTPAAAAIAAAVVDEARSAAERALFEALEAHPASKGLFVLNHELDVRFGPRALEIDLACASLRIAVEVDGYFHFLDVEAYRRDRRKDLALQREDYFVVRVLAEDVMAFRDDVVRIIHEVILLRRQGKNR